MEVHMRDRFQLAAEAVGATVKRFSSIADTRPYLLDLAAGGGISFSPLPAEFLAGLDGIIGGDDDPAGATLCISRAEAGIAATGSLLLDLQGPAGRAATALAPKHAVFLDPGTIVPSLHDLGEQLHRLLLAGDQAYLSLTTGPSRTADIERVLTIGVHGPKELHILILEGV
jgi:L-lactate dehydrogenase complex protein LldG